MATDLLTEPTVEEKAQACQAAMDAVQVGDVFYSSWGYDQTNVDYYVVVARTKASVRIQQVGTAVVEELGSGHDRVAAAVDHALGEPMLKRLKAWFFGGKAEVSLHLTSYSSAHPWDGRPKYQTALGWGH